MTREEAIEIFLNRGWIKVGSGTYFDGSKWREAIMVISDYFRNEYKALEQEPRKGDWLRMSDLSEQEDDRYKCSRCGNVVHYKSKMNLYTFNSWCGRCGSDNGRKIEAEL